MNHFQFKMIVTLLVMIYNSVRESGSKPAKAEDFYAP